MEDRWLQASVVRILNADYEPILLDCYYGFRPGRKAHDAIRTLRSHFICGKVMQEVEADIRSYFDEVNHEWLMKMLRLRVSDPVILRLVAKWLRAGVMENGVKLTTESGVPKGGPISCIFSNIYLHYVLDLWFEKRIKPNCKGRGALFRYVDDYVACFQFKTEADSFLKLMHEIFAEFNLRLAEEKPKDCSLGDSPANVAGKLEYRLRNFVFSAFGISVHWTGKESLHW